MRELWRPNEKQLKSMTDERMAQRMGEDWRTVWNPMPEQYRLIAMVDGSTGKFLMTAGEIEGFGTGTTTEMLYRDAWGTALLDAGRELLKSYIANKRYDWKFNGPRDFVLCGPGFGTVPLEEMKTLYQELHGWEIGIEINASCILLPEKSFGGWFERTKKDAVVDHKPATCHPGTGCQFCMLRGTPNCRQYHRKKGNLDLTKGEIQLPEDVLWEEIQGSTYGVAFDIGTTTMAAMAWDLSSDHRKSTPLNSMAMRNPLTIYGRDVISRIHTANGDPQRIEKMQRELLDALQQMTDELVNELRKSESEYSRDPVRVQRLSAVGNPTMMHFLFGKDPSGLAAAPFRGEELPLEITAESLGFTGGRAWTLDDGATLRTLPVMGGHLGADAAAALLAARLPEETGPVMMVDVGTNGELILADGCGRLWGCSTAAGPAFEGGAITPGSKFIDAAASMLEQGWMDEEGCVLRPILLNQEEIRQLQMAKSAVRAGVEVLQTIAGVSRSQILLAGTFGSHIKPQSAVKIGLLPEDAEIWNLGNLAGVGASLILLSNEEWKRGISWAKMVTHVELAEKPEFAEAFIRNMEFR